jgi:hypothetical protein
MPARRRSLFHYSPALILVVIAIADAGRFGDPDLWRHVIVGQSIIEHRRIPFLDAYSYSVYGHLWRNHEWLAEVITALFYNSFGVVGIKLMKFICTGAVMTFLAMAEAETGASNLMQFALLLLAGVTLGPFLQFRPQLFTFVLLSGLLVLFARDTYRGSARLWLAIPILALWANLHGGFVIGVAALGVYGGTCLVQDLFEGRGWRRGIIMGAITAGATLATLATPYGLGSWYAVAHSLLSSETRVAILEWRPLTVAMVEQWHEAHLTLLFYLLTFLMICALAGCVALRPRGGDFPLIAVAALMVLAAFASVRNIPLAAIAIAVPLGRHASLLMAGAGGNHNLAAETPASRWNQIILAALALFLMVDTGLFSQKLSLTIPYPEGAVHFIDRHSLHGNLLNDINWGDYLMWHEPKSKIFIDGRFETVYPLAVIQNYLAFYFDLPGGSRLLDQYPHDFVLIPPDCPAYPVMASRADWKLLYRDQNAALFARANSAAAANPAIPVITRVGKSSFP